MTMLIRPLSQLEVDGEAFWSLLWDAASVDSDALIWIRDVELPRLHVIGAVGEDDEVLGFAAYGVTTGRVEIHYLAVAAPHRGAHIGTRLIDAVRRAEFTLPVHAQTDDDAVDFYRALGFAVIPGGRDDRWPRRARYDCRIDPIGDPMDLTLAAYRRHALQYVQHAAPGPSRLVDELRALISPGASVLELGSGPGRDADALEAAGMIVDRTDAAASFLTLQRAAGHAARLLDVREPDFGGPYDAVFASAVLQHVPRGRLPQVLQAARRATRAGGVVAATFPQGDGQEWSQRGLDAARFVTYWQEAPLAEVFGAAGWREVVTRTDGEDGWISLTGRNPA